jgi:hypothetical protein
MSPAPSPDPQRTHPAVPRLSAALIAQMDDAALSQAVAWRDLLCRLWDEQPDTAVFPKWERAQLLDILRWSDGDVVTAFSYAADKLREIAEHAERQRIDPFNYGYEDPAWDDLDWGLMKKRLQHPGLPLEVLITGGNGGGKSFYCASRLIHFLAGQPRALAWIHSMDEQNSKLVMQSAFYHYLPLNYKTESGRNKKNVNVNLSYNVNSGFTNNAFSLNNGAVGQFRFWTKEMDTLEGGRPWVAQSDEMLPKPWKDSITRRLLTNAGPTARDTPLWEGLLRAKEKDPAMKFPRSHLHRLLRGFHLISFTPINGRTEVVREFQDGAVVVKSIDADLLPVRDASGEVTGCEKVPKEMQPRNPLQWCYFIHAWNNPIGGNWDAIRRIAPTETRHKILWWVYGVAENTVSSPFPQFSAAAHVREPAWMFGLTEPEKPDEILLASKS